MTLSFGGVPLLLQDPDGIADDHVRKYLDTRLASIFTPDLTCYTEDRNTARLNNSASEIQQVGLPCPNYAPAPKPQINTLRWPTGATRYAQGLFLIDGSNLTAILAALAGANGPQPLVMNAPANAAAIRPDSGINPNMYLLPPRPISPPNVPANERLWVLPLCDSRYFWQWKPVPYESTYYTSWGQILADLQTALGITITAPSVPIAYGIPDPIEWVRDWENAAMVLDALALTLGMRFVANWTTGAGQYRLVSAATSASDYQTNINATAILSNDPTKVPIVAGGDFSANCIASQTPGQVLVTFRNSDNSEIQPLVATIPAVTSPSDASMTKVFHTTVKDEGLLVLADSSLALANQLAVDYYAWLALRYDIDYAGILSWAPCGFDDYVLWEYAVKKGRRRQQLAQTRVQSYPYNFGTCNVPVKVAASSSSASQSSASISSQSQSSQSQSPSPSSGSLSSNRSSSVASSFAAGSSSSSSPSQSATSSGSSTSSGASSGSPSGSGGGGGGSSSSSGGVVSPSSNSSSSSSASSTSSTGGSGSGTGGCVTVVTNVSFASCVLTVTYGSAKAC